MRDERNVLIPMGFSLLTGLLIGGIAGLLYAPQSGARTRRQLANYAEDIKERAGEVVQDATEVIEKTLDRSRRHVGKFSNDVQERAGEVAEDTKAKINDVVERGRHLINA